MDLGYVGAYDAKTTQSNSDTSNDMSYEDVCAIAWKVYKAGKGTGKKGPSGLGVWHRGKGADEWTSGRRDDGGKEAKRAPRAANLIGTATKDKEAMGAKGKARTEARARVKPDTATTAESQGISG